MAKEKALGDDLKFEDIVDEVAGVYPKVMMKENQKQVHGLAAWWLD